MNGQLAISLQFGEEAWIYIGNKLFAFNLLHCMPHLIMPNPTVPYHAMSRGFFVGVFRQDILIPRKAPCYCVRHDALLRGQKER